MEKFKDESIHWKMCVPFPLFGCPPSEPEIPVQHVAQFEYFTNIPPHKTHIPLIRIPRSGGESASAITIFDGDVHKILHRVIPCALSR